MKIHKNLEIDFSPYAKTCPIGKVKRRKVEKKFGILMS